MLVKGAPGITCPVPSDRIPTSNGRAWGHKDCECQKPQLTVQQWTAQDQDALFKLQFEADLGYKQSASKLTKTNRSTNQDLLDGIDALHAEIQAGFSLQPSYIELSDML